MCGTMATDKPTPSPPRTGSARRSLFGPVDREQLRAEYRAALGRDLEEARRRWGFDFLSDKPLEDSGFQWEAVPGATVPQLYRSCVLGLRRAEGGRAAEEEAEAEAAAAAAVQPEDGGRVGPEEENVPCSPERCALNQEKLERTPGGGENTGLKRKQTNITDFYQAKRRVVGMPRKSGE
ncbi:cyclin-dependent kinase inhibitor 1 isoform X2 [Cebidichthys violaceus]|uniref:cyclin-dependent kinase inhibitor 1 isoform X2 n=1 Tax=Cebidichthys violaceus TaxID=271503 RepID=UPI0035CBE140